MDQYARKVNYYETDQMGIVHHSNYIRYFEEARLAWMERIGISYCALEQMGMIIPVLHVECQYKKPLHYGEEIVVRTYFRKFNGIKMEFYYEITDRENTETFTTGSSMHCFLNDDLKPFLIRKTHPDIYEKLMAALAEDGGKGRDIR